MLFFGFRKGGTQGRPKARNLRGLRNLNSWFVPDHVIYEVSGPGTPQTT